MDIPQNPYYGYSFKKRNQGGLGAIIHDVMLASLYAHNNNMTFVFTEEDYEIPRLNGSINDTEEPNKVWHSYFNSFEIKKESECKHIWRSTPTHKSVNNTMIDYSNHLQKNVCIFRPEIEEEIYELVKKTPFNSDTDIVLHIRHHEEKTSEINMLIPIETYIDECEYILSKFVNETPRIYICTDNKTLCIKIKEHFSKKNIDVIWDDNESDDHLHTLRLKGELTKKMANQETLTALKNIFIMKDTKYLIGARHSYFFRIAELLHYPKPSLNIQDSDKFGIAQYSSEKYLIRPYFKHAYPNFINPAINTKEMLFKYNKILKDEKIVNIPNFVSEEILKNVKEPLESYKWWAYSIKNSNNKNAVSTFSNLNNPAITENFTTCKKNLENKLFSYRFKKSVYTEHYKDCACVVCSVSKTIKSFPFTDLLSKIVGCKSLIPQEIFFSNYSENDFLSLHHDKNKGDIAVTISFTYDWHPTYGGILHFVDDNKNIFKSIVPKAGDLNIFILEHNKGLDHFVSNVTVNKNRFMVSSWYKIDSDIVDPSYLITSKSQIGQDTKVIEYYKEKQNGYFIEIGASDGITLSNTYLLEKKYNWRGICVEPIPDNYSKLIINRQNSICCDNAIYNISDLIVEFNIANNNTLF